MKNKKAVLIAIAGGSGACKIVISQMLANQSV